MDNLFEMNKNAYLNNNKILSDITDKLENIINDLNDKKQTNYIIKKVKGVITLVNNIISDNKKNYDVLKKEINKLANEFQELKYKLANNNSVVNKTKKYNNGKYIGEFKNGVREGKGIFIWNNDSKSERGSRNGKKDGKGKKHSNEGDRYEGEWKNGVMEGRGIYYFNDGDRYEGDFKNNKSDGKGTYYWNDGDKYDGEWKDDEREGKGIYYWSNGDRYEGDFKNNKKEGKGVKYWNSGDRYEGEWKNDEREGKGVYYYANGNREMGDYLNDKEIGKHAALQYNGNVSSFKY